MMNNINEPNKPLSPLIRLPKVATKLGIGKSTVLAWVADGRFIPPQYLGKNAVWFEEDVEHWILSNLKKKFGHPIPRQKSS